MKIMIMLAFAVIALPCRSQKQAQSSKDLAYRSLASFHKDTAAYFDYNFIQHKEWYINKPLSVLLKKLETPIASYMNGIVSNNKYIYRDIIIYSYDVRKSYGRMQMQLKPFNLIVTWKQSIITSIPDSLGRKNNSRWTNDEINYFGKQIVGDVLRTEYQYPRDKNEY